MTDDIEKILFDLVADLVNCDSLGDFQELRSETFRKLLVTGFSDKYYPREKILSAMVETNLLLDRGLRLEEIKK